ncbi:MAG TPA: PKD domain-containing protein [Myxococcota bacterium]|nr:PKD domain-containing protein [Myxococcota bacterium]
MLSVALALSGCSPTPQFRPVADAGPDVIVAPGQQGVLSGSGTDADGAVETFEWVLIGTPPGATWTLSDSGPQAAVETDKTGTYTVGLVVLDDDGNRSTMDVANVHAVSANGMPSAELIATGTLGTGEDLTLDGTASSDPDGDPLRYFFSIIISPEGSGAALEDVDEEIPYASFTPPAEGFYIVGLEVDDGTSRSVRSDLELRVTDTPNSGPIAVCPGQLEGPIGTAIDIDGSDSYDPDGDSLQYSWELISTPEGSSAELEGAGPVNRLTPDVDGVWRVGLAVFDGVLWSEQCEFTIKGGQGSGNNAPVADAGEDLLGDVDTPVLLDGRGSYDPEDDPLTAEWTFLSTPGTSALTDGDIESAFSFEAGFTPDVGGTYRLQLLACDQEPLCDTDTVTVTVIDSGNTPPVADAGDDQSGDAGDSFTLDGSDSYDPDGDTIDYQWTLGSIPAASTLTNSDIADATDVTAEITPDTDGRYEVILEVCDATDCDSDTVTIEAGDVGNTAPVADAGSDASGTLGATVTLDGSGSYDADGDPLTYRWGFKSVPSGSGLDNDDWTDRTTENGKFTPDTEGDYEIRLTVKDGVEEDSDLVTITVTAGGNTAPVADAGGDTTGTTGSALTLDGSGSYDVDGDPLTYRWGFKSVPSGSGLDNDDWTDRYTDSGNFTPDAAGDYEIRLTVNDGTEEDSDLATVTVTGGGNNPPVADAGSDDTVSVGSSANMDGSGSSDPDGDPLSYRWGFKSVPSGSGLDNTDWTDRYTDSGSFTPDVAGDFEVRLTVNDGTDEDSDLVTITATGGGANSPPSAEAGDDQSPCLLEAAQLNGNSSSDPDGDPLTYMWSPSSVPSGRSLTDSDLDGRWKAKVELTPDAFGTYTLELEVDDGTDTDTVDLDFDSEDAVLVLHLDETSGFTAVDDSPNGLDGSVTNDDWVGAWYFGGLSFDGTGDIVVPHDSAIDLVSDWSAEFWVKAEPSTSTAYQNLFIKPTSAGAATYSYSLWRYGNETVAFYGLNTSGSTNYAWATGASIGDGEWHHYVVNVTSGDDIEIYEDGALLTTGTSSVPLVTSTADLEIGAWSTYPGYELEGVLDELVLRDVALSGAEISDRYAAATQFCTEDSDSDSPAATITSPASGSSTNLGYVAIEGTASDDSEITSVSVNGTEALATSEGFATWVAYVSLASGSNSFNVSTEDIVGNSDSGADSVTVTFTDDCFDDYRMVLALDEDEGGSAVDASSYGSDGTGTGTDRVVGVFGNAAWFDGGASVTVPHHSRLSGGSAFTADFWFKADAPGGSQVLFHKGTYDYGVAITGSDLYCGTTDSGGTTYTAEALGVVDGDWHHVACTFNTTYLRLYVDGTREDMVSVGAASATNTDDLVIGEFGSATGFEYEGLIDHLRFVPLSSTAAEVSAMYSEGEQCAISDDLAPDGSASASADFGTYIDEATDEDDSTNVTYWLLPASTTGYVEVDLGEVVGVTRIRWLNTHNATAYTAAAEDFEIHVSTTGDFDGEETIVETGSDDLEDDLRHHQVDLSDPVPGRYVRFYVDSYHELRGGLNELEIYGL